MNSFRLVEVTRRSQERLFLDVAVMINGGDPNWVQPLDVDILSVFDPAKNHLFIDGEAIRWVLMDGEKAVGRIAAFYNRQLAAKEEQPTGGCGFFECIDNRQAANVLFDAAREWLRERGMEAMDGSVNFGDRMSWWGVLAEGFHQPLYGSNYNPEYYTGLFEGYGFQNYYNQHIYLRRLESDILLNSALLEKAARIFANPEYTFCNPSLKNIEKLAEDFRKVYNSGWANFEGVKPLTQEHALELIRTMRPVIDPEVIFFAYHNGVPVGFFVMIPDLNQIIGDFGGKFGLIQKLKLLYRLKFTRRINRLTGVVFGVSSDYQGKGIESGMIRQFEIYAQRRHETGKTRYRNLEMMWIGDFNPVMMRVCESYVNSVKYKRLVTYRYLFDREKPFSRAPRLGKKR
ncbi:hypothetical protein BN938_2846 [Mucinivorans hirudinis]|uniref:N-acetyltransferase domain-containing protein n=1 Tax=Mucinivorans hirudinis TaxID=1433126 RepID=A0A060RBF6_9BACT|nr:hypothetical protein BN938_2846 [Mucinivorans hirudinis]